MQLILTVKHKNSKTRSFVKASKNSERYISKLQNFNKQVGIKTASLFCKVVVNHRLSFLTECPSRPYCQGDYKVCECFFFGGKLLIFPERMFTLFFIVCFSRTLLPLYSPFERTYFFSGSLCTRINTAVSIFDEVICFTLFDTSLSLLTRDFFSRWLLESEL